jgi:hypothetical protein
MSKSNIVSAVSGDGNLANFVGNLTETVLHKSIDSSPIGQITPIGKAAKRGASEIAGNVNKFIRNRSNGGGGGRGNPPPSGFGSMSPPSGPGNNDGASVRKQDMLPSGGALFPIDRLNTNPEAYTFELNTGIKTPAYSPLYQNSSSNQNFSMHMVALTIGYTTDAFPVSQFVSSAILATFSNAIQRAVNFSASITSTQLLAYMNSIISGLNAYFYVKSILAYHSNVLNRNDAMLALRAGISSTDLNYLYELERLLLGTPIPPNLINYIWWLNNVYVDSTLPGATILKIYPESNGIVDSSGNFTTNIPWVNIISGINAVTNTSNLISRATPNWVNQGFPPYTGSPVYDANWHTLFINSLIWCSNSVESSLTPFPSIASPTSSWQYASMTNDLDGSVFAMACIYDATNATVLPSLCRNFTFSFSAVVGYFTNRISFWNGSWADMNSNASLTSARLCSNGMIWQHGGSPGVYSFWLPPGTEVVLGVNESSVTQASLQLAEWLFSIDTIGYIKDNRVYDGAYNIAIGNSGKRNKRR